MQYIKSSAVAKERMVRAYRMMLDFFGMNLKDEATGVLQRARNWRERVTHLNRFVSMLFSLLPCRLSGPARWLSTWCLSDDARLIWNQSEG